jgi:hypothetical protein
MCPSQNIAVRIPTAYKKLEHEKLASGKMSTHDLPFSSNLGNRSDELRWDGRCQISLKGHRRIRDARTYVGGCQYKLVVEHPLWIGIQTTRFVQFDNLPHAAYRSVQVLPMIARSDRLTCPSLTVL